jgi:phage repressor protein C with HTH and peptisase S24 domain
VVDFRRFSSLGKFLAAYRASFEDTADKFTMFDVEDVLEYAQSYVSRIERGAIDKTIKRWNAEHQDRLLRAYRLPKNSIRDISKHFGLQAHLLSNENTFDKYAVRDLDLVRVPVYSSASAGSGKSEEIEDYTLIPREALRGRVEKSVFSVLVNGNCLVSHEVRFNARNIAHGDYATVDPNATPKSGDIVLFWDNRDEKLIIKLYRESGSSIVLYDAKGVMVPKPMFDNDLTFKGVVFWRSGSMML